MYCRSCGNELSPTASVCIKCRTPRGEGVNYCHNCGYHTTINTIHCSDCGAKQRTIITQQMKKAKLDEIQKKVKHHQLMMKIGKVMSIISILAFVILFVVLEARPEPDNIPDIEDMNFSSNGFIHDGFLRAGDTYYYDSSIISDEVAEYWVQGRTLIMYMVFAVFIFIGSFIDYLVQKSAYKKVLKKAKEVQ